MPAFGLLIIATQVLMVVFAWLLNVWTARSPVTISILFSVGVSGSVFHPFTWKAHKRLKYSKDLVRSIIFQPRNVVFCVKFKADYLRSSVTPCLDFRGISFTKDPFLLYCCLEILFCSCHDATPRTFPKNSIHSKINI